MPLNIRFNSEQEIREHYLRDFDRRAMYLPRPQARALERQMRYEIEREIQALTQRNIDWDVSNWFLQGTEIGWQVYQESRPVQFDTWLGHRRHANEGITAAPVVERANNTLTYNLATTMPYISADELALKTKERKEDQMKVKQVKQELITNKAAEASLIRCGFELETQQSNDLTGDERPINEDLVNDRINENASFYRRDYSFLKTWTTQERLDKFLNEDSRMFKYGEFIDSLTESELSDLEDASIEYARMNFNESDYQLSPQDCFDLNTLEVGLDSSVSGFEFKTRGPKTIKEFKEAVKEVFKVNHEIDERCSFHIHLSVKGITHVYSEGFQLLLVEGLLKQAGKVPDSVIDRWGEGFNDFEECGKYFDWEGGHGKYCAISKHNNFNTWEFRCFGNITNYKDAVRCLRISINAMKYAYERQLNKEGPQVLTWQNVQDIAESISRGNSWDSSISDIVKQQQQAA